MGQFEFLSSELHIDILSRLQTRDVIRLKRVSKTLHHLLSNHLFIEAQLRKREPLFGFFVQHRFEWCLEDIKTINFIPIQKEVTKAQSHQRIFEFLPEDVVVLSSCDGLICCRSCFPYEKPAIYVCNPLNKQWRKLDWSDPNKESNIGLAFEPCQDGFVYNLTNFKVVRVRQATTEDEELYFLFDVYSSKTGVWRLSKEICWCSDTLKKNGGIYISGVLYWLTDGCKILTFNVQRELAWLISSPIPSNAFEIVPKVCIGESEGKLHYVMISEEGLQVWFVGDCFELNWSIKHSKTLAELETENSKVFFNLSKRIVSQELVDSSPWMAPLAFKDTFLLMKVWDTIYLYDIETSTTEKVCDFSDSGMSSPLVLPYSLSLVPLSQSQM